MVPLWTFSGQLIGATIEKLANDQFRNNLLLAALALCCVVFAILLSMRAVTREARVAELKSGFVSNVSPHEMKPPLSLIRVFAETLDLGRVSDPSKLREYYRVIHNESRRLTQLIDRVLDLASMEAGRKTYQFVITDLGPSGEFHPTSLPAPWPITLRSSGRRLNGHRPNQSTLSRSTESDTSSSVSNAERPLAITVLPQ
jgi:signal transduction histidine kinase